MALQSINTRPGQPSTIDVTVVRPFRMVEREEVDGVHVGQRVLVTEYGETRRLPVTFAGELVAAGKVLQGKVAADQLVEMGYAAPAVKPAKAVKAA